MKITPLIFCLLSIYSSTQIYAAGMDQSGQSILAFLEDGHYAEASITAVSPDISGKIRNRPDLVASGSSDLDTGDMIKDIQYYSAAMKFQLSPRVSFGLLYDQPFGSNTEYPMKANNTFSDNQYTFVGTKANVETQNLTTIIGFQPNKYLNFYAGGVYQSMEGNVSLRGNSMGIFNGYDANFLKDNSTGWLAGVAYQIPEIALKAALTYRSKIDYSIDVQESLNGEIMNFTEAKDTKIITPKSINLDFQTGVSQNTLLYLNARWVNWKNSVIRPAQFGALSELATAELSQGAYSGGFNLDDYRKDQWSAALGVGHQFNEKISASTDVSWDSGTGNPAGVLGPIHGGWGLGLGLQYNPTPKYFLSAGLRYIWFGDAVAQDGTYFLPIEGISQIAEQADFKDNTAMVYGLKIGYKF